MKKSIIFGVLAMFAVSAMGIQSVEAQNPVKKNTIEEKTVKPEAQKLEKTTTTTAVSVDKKDSKDCCADKKVSAEKKDCCEGKKVAAEKKDSKSCCSEKKGNCEKKVKGEGKKVKKADAVKPKTKKEESKKAE